MHSWHRGASGPPSQKSEFILHAKPGLWNLLEPFRALWISAHHVRIRRHTILAFNSSLFVCLVVI